VSLRLSDLEPRFLKREDDTHFRDVETLSEADGLWFLCPKCFLENRGRVGTHAVVCWSPSVPQTTHPVPGRWTMVGTGFHDLSLVAGSSSVQLTAGCLWHGHVTNGDVTGV
jgi:hypothetical protein